MNGSIQFLIKYEWMYGVVCFGSYDGAGKNEETLLQ